MAIRTLSVTELNNYIKRLFDTNSILKHVSVEGEISNLTRASSGHYYFSLKDQASEVRCILWASTATRVRFRPDNGLAVRVTGAVQVYPQRGSYSIIISSMQPAGVGTLYKIYLERLRQLKERGWLDQEIKKELPEDIKTVGVVTSETGAVIHDIITTIRRRNPLINILLVPANVQGEGAAESIAAGIRQLNEEGSADVIIVGRGGGSMEDLWAFNEPPVIKAIHESRLPIVSAVGHETDNTIADYISDLRAPTPTAAAEFVSGGLQVIFNQIDAYSARLSAGIVDKFNRVSSRLDSYKNRLYLASPESRLVQSQFKVDELDLRIRSAEQRRVERLSQRLETLRARLELLNPKFMFERGYAMVTDRQGKIVRTTGEAYEDKDLVIHFSDGKVNAVVEEENNG